MHQNLAIILLQFNYIKNSFIVLIPSLLIYNFHAKYYLEKSKSYLTMRAIDSGIAAYIGYRRFESHHIPKRMLRTD